MTPDKRNETVEALLNKTRYDFNDLLDVMAILRMPGGCKWDAEQTHESIRDNFIEETYEVVEAIDNGDYELMQEELGDALLQVVFHARIAEESERFSIDDVVNDIARKLIHRHPHVFGSVVATTAEEMLANWEKIKTEEKSRDTLVSRLEAIPPHLPSLMRASKIAKKTEFLRGERDCDAVYGSLLQALDALRSADDTEKEYYMGEMLFSVAELCRKLSVSGEAALMKATDRRVDEVRKLETHANGIALESMSPEELAELRRRLDTMGV